MRSTYPNQSFVQSARVTRSHCVDHGNRRVMSLSSETLIQGSTSHISNTSIIVIRISTNCLLTNIDSILELLILQISENIFARKIKYQLINILLLLYKSIGRSTRLSALIRVKSINIFVIKN